MSGYIEGVDREQTNLFPGRLEDWIGEDHPVRIVDVFVDALDLSGYGFDRAAPAKTGRPGYSDRQIYANRMPELFQSGRIRP